MYLYFLATYFKYDKFLKKKNSWLVLMVILDRLMSKKHVKVKETIWLYKYIIIIKPD